MKAERVSVKVVLDLRREKNNTTYPIKLRITFKGARRYYSTSYNTTKDEWEQINGGNAKGNLRKIKYGIIQIEIEAQKKIENFTPFSFSKFEDEFFTKPTFYSSILSMYNKYIDELKLNEQIGTAINYQCAINSLLNFKPSLTIKEITVEFLNSYERWMLKGNKSITTISMYVRTLRTILNIAKSDGVIGDDDYPFGARKYVVPSGKNVKKALNKVDIQKIFEYSTEYGSNMDMAKDFWLFSYLCNGINMTDIAYLRWRDLSKTTIIFERRKTKNTNRSNLKKIVAIRNEKISSVIKKWGRANKSPDNHIFEILEKKDTAERQKAKILQFTKVVNKWMKRIGKDLKFDLPLTTYVARHSFATALVHSGAPLSVTKELLGHSNALTTENYIASLPIEAIKEYTKGLDKFD